MPVRVQTEDFDLTAEVAALRARNPKIGAVACFVGTVRDLNEGSTVETMELEHYQIVLVATTAAHRGDAFAACEFVMDYLKSEAPFWKKEKTEAGERWVDARVTDDAALARWGIESGNRTAK